MKTLLRLGYVLFVLVFCFSCAKTAPMATNESGFQLTIELRDGSRVIGKTPNENLSFHSATLGDLKLAWSSIRSIEYASSTNTARLTATNGDTLVVNPSADTVRVETSYGKNEIPMKLVKSIKVAAVAKPGQLPDGLVSLWSGEGNANDSVGGNNGTLTGSATFGPGKVGQGFVFDGRNGSGGALGNPASLQLSNLTVECWIKRSSTTAVSYGSGGNGTIYGCGLLGYCFLVDWTGQLVFGHCVSNVKITDTNYHHVAMTLTDGMAMVYLDGAAVSPPANNSDLTFAGLMGIGYRPDNQDNSFLGTFDEIGVFNRALTAVEIQAIYTGQK